MRLGVVTPVDRASAVGRVMVSAAETLASEHDVAIFAPVTGDRLRTTLPLRPFEWAGPDLAAELAALDVAVYAIGDHPWHAEILRVAREVPGLVVLHDASITNLVHGMYARADRLGALADEARALYGETIAGQLATTRPDTRTPAWFAVCAAAPFTEVAVRSSLGVVTHSAWAAERIEGMTLGDVTVVGLPVEAPDHPPTRHVPVADTPGAFAIVTVGAVNANRRLDLVLDAIAADPTLRSHAVLTVAGRCTDDMRAALERQAAELGLGDALRLLGDVADDQLDDVLERADVCLALRDPTLEAASASVLEQMRAGRPVLVFDHAHYAELPDDAVVKLPPAGGAAGIGAALRRLAADPTLRQRVGARGREHVRTAHTPLGYAAGLAVACERAMAARPAVATMATVGAQLARAGLGGSPLARRIAADAALDLLRLDDGPPRTATSDAP